MRMNDASRVSPEPTYMGISPFGFGLAIAPDPALGATTPIPARAWLCLSMGSGDRRAAVIGTVAVIARLYRWSASTVGSQ